MCRVLLNVVDYTVVSFTSTVEYKRTCVSRQRRCSSWCDGKTFKYALGKYLVYLLVCIRSISNICVHIRVYHIGFSLGYMMIYRTLG